MAKLVGVSGTHGCGKGTLLAHLKVKGFRIDDFSVARYVQKEIFQVDQLNKAIPNPLSVIAFQEVVLRVKYQHDKKLLDEDAPLILVERTFADIAAYTSLWMTKFGVASDWFNWMKNSYIPSCMEYQRELYDTVIYVSPIDFWESDPLRGHLEDRELFNDILLDQLSTNDGLVITTGEGSAIERAERVYQQLQQHYLIGNNQ